MLIYCSTPVAIGATYNINTEFSLLFSGFEFVIFRWTVRFWQSLGCRNRQSSCRSFIHIA